MKPGIGIARHEFGTTVHEPPPEALSA